jgi:hypothetical protein
MIGPMRRDIQLRGLHGSDDRWTVYECELHTPVFFCLSAAIISMILLTRLGVGDHDIHGVLFLLRFFDSIKYERF